jgi:hypothetical protein
MPGACLVTVGAAALFGISIAARGEYTSKQPRVNEWRLAAMVTHDKDSKPEGGPFSNYKVGSLVADVLASSKKGEVVHVGAEQLK